MKRYFLIFNLMLFCQSCSVWQKEQVQTGNYETAIKNAVIDFSHSSLASKDKVFSLTYKQYDKGVIGISILGDVNKVYLINGTPQGRVKDQYIEYDNKLFCWYDDKKEKDSNIIKKLTQYKVIDNVEVLTEDMEYIRDDTKKGVNYYFCKDNLLIYKKEETSIVMPREIKIDLHCTQ
ncbi:hypothetical protein N6B72_16925 [Chryseobacterium soli]|uniref:hypothetical protein n=1 Tax=Chryseobacterium soli TaxID=445961 RepID=UPI002954A136|nr:hypothetical protein [Chryseobacterium soli]MDV7698613.1 hypothetical protein [Chryseobacterium soli]